MLLNNDGDELMIERLLRTSCKLFFNSAGGTTVVSSLFSWCLQKVTICQNSAS